MTHMEQMEIFKKKDSIRSKLRMEAEKLRKLKAKGKVPPIVSIFPDWLKENKEFQHFCNVTFVEYKN